MRRFRVISAGNTALNGKEGTLVGAIEYAGCRSGWHTLQFDDGITAMFTGTEVMEVMVRTDTEK